MGRPLLWLSVDLGPDANAGRDFTAAISPDGTYLVFPVNNGGTPRLALRHLAEPNATLLPGTERGFNPFFLPDGEWVGFGAEGKLKKVSIQGGVPMTLCDGVLRGASWGEDGYIVGALGDSTGLSRIPESGGAPSILTKPENGEYTHRLPQIIPGGHAVLFSVNSSQSAWDQARIDVLSLKTGQQKTVQRGGFYGR